MEVGNVGEEEDGGGAGGGGGVLFPPRYLSPYLYNTEGGYIGHRTNNKVEWGERRGRQAAGKYKK